MPSINNLTPVEGLQLVVNEEMASLRITDFPLVDLLPKENAFQNQIKWNVNVSTDGSVGSSVNADANAASSDTVETVILPIGSSALRETVDILKTDIRQASATAPGALRNLLGFAVRTKLT